MLLNLAQLVLSPRNFKSNLVNTRFRLMNPKLQKIALDAYLYALSIGVDQPVFTETATTKAEDKALKRVSTTHHERRAFDFRVKDWSGEQIDAMIKYLTDKYNQIGAVQKDGSRKVVVYHDSGHGFHFHVQLDKTFALPEIK
jgi:hypothetical protein